MKCETKTIGEFTVFKIFGDLTYYTLEEIRQGIKKDVAESKSGKFIMDLDRVHIIDSAGYGFVVSVYKTVASHDSLFAVVAPDPDVRETFRSGGFTRLFGVHASEDDAMKAL